MKRDGDKLPQDPSPKISLAYFRDLRKINIVGIVFVSMACVGFACAVACIIIRSTSGWRELSDALVLFTFLSSVAGASGGIGNCLTCAGRVEQLRGAALSAVAAITGILAFCLVVLAVAAP